jgi:hypothetical protein
MNRNTLKIGLVTCLLAAALITPSKVNAHCDTLAGPVIADARLALKSGDVTPVLKWVKPEAENEIRAAFTRAIKVRSKGPDAQELADTYFFETLVRVHRAGEGAPYTGLKSESVETVIAATDQALESDSIETLLKMVGDETARGIRQKFVHAAESKKHAGDSVMAGRAYVAAYVELTHYVEALHKATAGLDPHNPATEAHDSH